MAGKIRNTNLNQSVITGHTENVGSDSVANDDKLLIYDTTTNSLRKTNVGNIGLTAPEITSISPTTVATAEGQGTITFTITGTGFTSGTTAKLVTNFGSNQAFDSVTIDSETQLTCTLTRSTFTNANEPYSVSVTGGSGLTTQLDDQIYVDAAPTFVTAAGSLGNTRYGDNFIVEAFDPESGSDPTFELSSGAFPPGMSIINTDSGRCTIGGTISPLEASDTVYTFTLKALDANSNVAFREFSITANGPSYTSFTSSGTYSVPVGTTSVEVLVVGGGAGTSGKPGGPPTDPGVHGNNGGGGAGGLVFATSYPVTPGGTVSVTVGDGGFNEQNGQDSVFGTITAQGGGYGKVGFYIQAYQPGAPGGSGGGGGQSGRGITGPGGSGTQGPSGGGTGYGNSGGSAGGGGGGAGQSGSPGVSGKGGDGRAYTISDGSTPIYYAGGGGGATGVGGAGGGGPNPAPSVPNPQDGLDARGSGGAGRPQTTGPENVSRSTGGSGIVIIKG